MVIRRRFGTETIECIDDVVLVGVEIGFAVELLPF
jgi:hypothetical protein